MLHQEHLLDLTKEYILPWTVHFLVALLIFIIGRFIARTLSRVVGRLLRRSRLDRILVDFVQSMVHALLLVFVIVAALDQIGVNTTSLIAVLGAAGLAIGLALQGSLQNFAAGFMLLVFRPFKAGDFIEAAGTSGVVEKINIFSTVLRSGDNKEVIVPNGTIYNGNIINYSARATRRIDMAFNIDYDNDIKKIREILNGILATENRILVDPPTVIAVSELTANYITIVVRPWVNTNDYWPVKFDLNEKIKLAFDDKGITPPFQQMGVHIMKSDGANP